MTDTTPTAQLSAAGVSIWLDDLSRERITSGGLEKLIEEKNVVGVTTNPSIFAAALTNGESYAAQVAELAKAGKNVTEAVFEITTQDVANGCDIFRPSTTPRTASTAASRSRSSPDWRTTPPEPRSRRRNSSRRSPKKTS